MRVQPKITGTTEELNAMMHRAARWKSLEALDALPDKPSELLQICLFDFQSLYRNPHFEVRTFGWYGPSGNGTLNVSPAGCVMAHRLLPEDCDNYVYPHSFASDEIENKLNAIDLMTRGLAMRAMKILGIKGITEIPYFPVKHLIPFNCKVDHEIFRKEMREIIRDLRDWKL